MRDGQYAIVRYDSTFAHKAAAVESVTLDFGKWRLVGDRLFHQMSQDWNRSAWHLLQ